MNITFITGNPGKAQYLATFFGMPFEHQKLDLIEIQSLSLEEVVRDKAQRAFDILQKPVLIEDVSLVFTALNQLPGPLIKWFGESLGNNGICSLLDGLSSREAVATVMFALHDGNEIHLFEGSVSGLIAPELLGENGFGWDSIFIPAGYEKTWGEMSPEEKHETSMRKIALEKMYQFLQK